MKNIISVLFLALALLFSIPSHTETYVKAPEIVKPEKPKIAPHRHTRAETYKEPPAHLIPTIQRVSDATGYSTTVISRIIWAESRYLSSAVNLNTNKTTDHGYFQINSQHIPTAKKMGIDIFTDEGNIQYTIFLMKTQGLSPWNSSKKNWN